MKHYAPDLRTPEDSPPQTRPEDKIGGLPWGLRPSAWPVCAECRGSQSFVAQWHHHPERLDLGKAGRVLFVFHCCGEEGCSSWEGDSGCNSCFVVEPEDLLPHVTPLPEGSPYLEDELRVRGWLEQPDDLPPTPESAERIGTRFGGAPIWLQGSDDAPGSDWRFVGQIDSNHDLLSLPENGKFSKDEQGRYFGNGPGFGDGGVAYLYLRPRKKAFFRLLQKSTPEGWFFWQCC